MQVEEQQLMIIIIIRITCLESFTLDTETSINREKLSLNQSDCIDVTFGLNFIFEEFLDVVNDGESLTY